MNLLSRRTLLKSVVAAAAIPWWQPISASGQEKILLDTDIGSDIDDAVALAYLLSEPRCELLGVTTVTGAAYKRTALTKHLVEAAGKNIPVVTGYENPLVIEQRQGEAPQASKLSSVPEALAGDPGDAVEFLRENILRHRGEVTLLAVGPFTNVARLIEADPEILSNLKELVIMGGKYSDFPTPWGPTEWNAIVDPHATDQLFRYASCPVRAFGLDITWQLSMSPREVAAHFADHPLLRIVLDWSEVWFAERDMLHFHDPLAAMAIFHHEVCAYSAGEVFVELEPGDRQGVTTFRQKGSGNVRVASSVDQSIFFSRFFQTFQSS